VTVLLQLGWRERCESFFLEIPGLGDVLFCHATPRNDTEIFTRLTPDDRPLPIFEGLGVSVVVCALRLMGVPSSVVATVGRAARRARLRCLRRVGRRTLLFLVARGLRILQDFAGFCRARLLKLLRISGEVET
jgi:hypothetical protein